MPLPSKGERRLMGTRVTLELGALVEQAARDRGCSSVSQYLADLIAVAHNRPDLVRELNQEELKLAV